MAIMNFYSMTDNAIVAELGQRIRARRLRLNRTQQELADAVGLSLNTVKALEKGQSKLITLVSVLRELNALDELTGFLPAEDISPLQLAKMQGKKRQRASGSAAQKDESSW